MKIQFKELDYQTEAVEAVLSVFEGQQIRKSEFTIRDEDAQGKLFGEKGIGNKIDVSESKLLQNIQQLQIKQGIPISKSIPFPFPQFNIEMETGTGKTFVYLKSILEMNRKYGFTKFIIVVPSVAIKEGVNKTLEMTEEYFKSQMQGLVYNSFMYDSSKLDKVKGFATNDTVEIMVINIQAFNSEDNIFNRNDQDSLFGYSPKEYIAETNPIVIIDEPQSVDTTTNAKGAIAALNPSIVFRFSATHKEEGYPLLYKLGPVEAYQNKLVKQIEVAGVKRPLDGNEAHLRLLGIKSTKTSVTASVEIIEKSKSGLAKKVISLKKNDDLVKKTKLTSYEKIGFVQNISAEEGNEYIEFRGESSKIIYLRQAHLADLEVKRGQIRKTIEEHLNKELKLNAKGIKVLSLFFIDNVANYRVYEEEGKAYLGEYGRIFEEEYTDVLKSPKYQMLCDYHIPVNEVHNGYFSIDKKGNFKNGGEKDESAFQIIMKDKEDLLTMYDEKKGKTKNAHKLRFIFSHSALKEGWDNPNVFQICTLIDSKDELTKRQKIGRGLRIAVNQQGERVYGFKVNTLTVMANESYEEFAEGLQHEYEKEGMKFGVFTAETFSSLILEVDELTGYQKPLGHEYSKKLFEYLKEQAYIDNKGKGTEALAKVIKDQVFELPEEYLVLADNMTEKVIAAIEQKFNTEKIQIKDHAKKETVRLNKEALSEPFLELWERIKYKTTYSIQFDSEQFIRDAAKKLKDELLVRIQKLEYERKQLKIEQSGIEEKTKVKTSFTTVKREYKQAPDILTELQQDTKLTRRTLIAILKQSDTLGDFKVNPQMYMMEAARIINAAKRLAMVDGVKYEKLGADEVYDQSLFQEEEIEWYEDSIIKVLDNRSPYDHIIIDSKVEREFVEACEQDINVKFYIKLPADFKIKTPLGNYNPDWALSVEEDGKDKLYFIVETKGSIAAEDLRPTELAKIRCGEKHFKAIETGITFKKATALKEVY